MSALGLGTLHWGADTDVHEAGEILEVFLDAGGSTVDTTAGIGAGEEVLGGLLGSSGQPRAAGAWSPRPGWTESWAALGWTSPVVA